MKFQTKEVLGELCEVHGCQLWMTLVPIKGKLEQLKQCPECTKAAIGIFEKKLNAESEVNSKLADTYAVFERYSLVSDKLRAKSLDNYEIKSEIDQKAINFVKRMEQFYRQGKTGNAIVTGPSGVGKSHLTYGFAKWLNEQFKAYESPKSILFISLVSLFTKIKESFKVDNGYRQADMIELLTRVDYLFLDDLGKESRKGDSQNNEWTHQILYEILDNRSNTIINTNLSSKEIKALYADNYGNGALSSRILEGVTGNSFAYPKDMEDRRY
ncbi:prophage LambdaSa2, DNA replication protein DnaC [Streptococcus pyogenes]|uniref:ATP-binding protein n=1 Tax=Streptococcus pyogenes TaxID=1314 RepID=UPI00109D4335|nr:ATP-binding protein [Streptococcus pyogenes]VGT50068.1 prophage LambdaSa2, DNA replication protein DnaC [Streptococcus pyogenes]HEQ3179425.1 ATP-binding protein [Streptococcus pyogenes]HER2924587.1 ATP-binding protein [Streptococcus pyogenes]